MEKLMELQSGQRVEIVFKPQIGLRRVEAVVAELKKATEVQVDGETVAAETALPTKVLMIERVEWEDSVSPIDQNLWHYFPRLRRVGDAWIMPLLDVLLDEVEEFSLKKAA